MNRTIKNICLLLAFVLGIAGCRELDVQKYENDPRLYFFKGNYNLGVFEQGDSTVHSFFLAPDGKMRDTVLVEIRVMGCTSPQTRSFRMVQTNLGEPDAAVPGVHYIDFDDSSIEESMKIPANAWRYQMPIVVLRDPSLATGTVRIKMAIAPNENFGIGLDTLSRFMVTTTSMAAKPFTWDSNWVRAFGNWGSRKMWFVMNYVGITDFDDVSGLKDMTYCTYLKTYAQDKLKEYNNNEKNEDRPLREANGDKVGF